MEHFVRIPIFDRDLVNPEATREIGELTIRHSTGEAYFIKSDGTEKPLRGQAFRDLYKLLDKNKIRGKENPLPTITGEIPLTTIEDLDMRTNIFMDAKGMLSSTMETYSVHNILIERDFDNLEEWQDAPVLKEIRFKRLSFRTLARDVELLDNRINPETNQPNGITNADDMLSYMLNMPLELDSHMDAVNSNKRLGTDENDKLTNTVKIRLRKLDNPMSNLTNESYTHMLLTGKAGLQIKSKIDDDIAALRIFKDVQITNTNEAGTVTTSKVAADNNHDTLIIRTDNQDGIRTNSFIHEDGNIVIGHSLIGTKVNGFNLKTADTPAYVNVAEKKIDVISKIVMDKNGHIIEMATKNIYPEINARFYNKEESDTRFVNANNAMGTEIMEGGLTVNKDVEIKGSLKVTKDLLVEGESSTLNVTNVDIEDTLISLAKGNVDNSVENIGIRFKRGVNGAAGKDRKDVYFIFNRTTNSYMYVYADTNPTNKNVLENIELADVKAENFIGLVSRARKMEAPIKVDFTGDDSDAESGILEFDGAEEVVRCPIVIKKSSMSRYGVVKIHDDPNNVPSSIDKIYSAQFVHDRFKELLNINIVHSLPDNPTVDESKALVSASVARELLERIEEFERVYMAQEAAKRAERESAATAVYSSSKPIYFTWRFPLKLIVKRCSSSSSLIHDTKIAELRTASNGVGTLVATLNNVLLTNDNRFIKISAMVKAMMGQKYRDIMTIAGNFVIRIYQIKKVNNVVQPRQLMQQSQSFSLAQLDYTKLYAFLSSTTLDRTKYVDPVSLEFIPINEIEYISYDVEMVLPSGQTHATINDFQIVTDTDVAGISTNKPTNKNEILHYYREERNQSLGTWLPTMQKTLGEANGLTFSIDYKEYNTTSNIEETKTLSIPIDLSIADPVYTTELRTFLVHLAAASVLGDFTVITDRAAQSENSLKIQFGEFTYIHTITEAIDPVYEYDPEFPEDINYATLVTPGVPAVTENRRRKTNGVYSYVMTGKTQPETDYYIKFRLHNSNIIANTDASKVFNVNGLVVKVFAADGVTQLGTSGIAAVGLGDTIRTQFSTGNNNVSSIIIKIIFTDVDTTEIGTTYEVEFRDFRSKKVSEENTDDTLDVVKTINLTADKALPIVLSMDYSMTNTKNYYEQEEL